MFRLAILTAYPKFRYRLPLLQIYDCDFNQQLGMSVGGGRSTIHDIESLDELMENPIKLDDHCFGCTAGMGSS